MIKRVLTTFAIVAALVLGVGGAAYAGVQIHERWIDGPHPAHTE